MVEQVIDIIREMVVTIVENTFSTFVMIMQSLIKLFSILGSSASSSLSTMIITLIFISAFLFLIYKFLWASAKTMAIFLIIVILLFILSVFVI